MQIFKILSVTLFALTSFVPSFIKLRPNQTDKKQLE